MAYHRVLRTIVARQPQAVLSFYFDSSGRDEIMKDIPFDDRTASFVSKPGQ